MTIEIERSGARQPARFEVDVEMESKVTDRDFRRARERVGVFDHGYAAAAASNRSRSRRNRLPASQKSGVDDSERRVKASSVTE